MRAPVAGVAPQIVGRPVGASGAPGIPGAVDAIVRQAGAVAGARGPFAGVATAPRRPAGDVPGPPIVPPSLDPRAAADSEAAGATADPAVGDRQWPGRQRLSGAAQPPPTGDPDETRRLMELIASPQRAYWQASARKQDETNRLLARLVAALEQPRRPQRGQAFYDLPQANLS